MGEQREVRLLGVPVEIWREAASHADGLQREFDLILSSDESPDRHDVPARLLSLIEDLRARYGGVGDAPNAELQAAADEGRASIDLTYQIPVEACGATAELARLLDEADDYCREGRLLTLVASPRALAFRRWFLGEFVRQLDGAEPREWSPSDETPEATTTAAPPTEVTDWLDHGMNTAYTAVVVDREVVRVALLGDIDLVSGEQVRTVLQRISAIPCKQIVLDLSRTTFVDSVGLSVIMACRARSSDLGREVVINVPPALLRTFHRAGLEQFVESTTTVRALDDP